VPPLPPVYTKLLGALEGASAGASEIGTPPAGFAWIVTDIVLTYESTDSVGLAGADVVDDNGYVFMEVHQPWAVSGNDYHWSGRQVLNFGHILYLDGVEGGWCVRVTGYELALP
jgi:hypothetical protein